MAAALIALLLPPALVLVAHILRALRWTLLFPAGALNRRFDLLLALGVGYAANLALPVHVGDIVRAVVASRRTESLRFAYVLATVAVERLTDLVAVSAIFTVMAAMSDEGGAARWIAPAAMAAAALAGVAVAVSVRRYQGARQAIWRAASIFNNGVRAGVADFFWSFGEIATGPTVLRWRFALASVAMWAMYLTAYWALARFIGRPARHRVAGDARRAAERPRAPYRSPRVRAALGAADRIRHPADSRHHPLRRRAGMAEPERRRSPLQAIRHVRRRCAATMREQFKALATYEQYLSDLFDGAAGRKRGFERKAIGDSIVHKFFNGGSDAVTALVEVGGELRIRKFALDAAAEKLAAQAVWLTDPARSHAPLAPRDRAR